MYRIFLYLLLMQALTVCGQGTAKQRFSLPDTGLLRYSSDAHTPDRFDAQLLESIRAAGPAYTVADIAEIIQFSQQYRSKSDTISLALTNWLREDHPLYEGRRPTETNQIRGYLVYSLSKFKPNEVLYRYVSYELQFGEYSFNVAAAAYTARNFESKSAELIDLFKPYLNPAFRDEIVDITTPILHYPPAHPTRVRYEILETLVTFGPSAYPALKMIDELNSYLAANPMYNDADLLIKSQQAFKKINDVTPACCRRDGAAGRAIQARVIPAGERKRMPEHLMLTDQNGARFAMRTLQGKAFVLAFFYTRCANFLKCASTVDKLARLQKKLDSLRLTPKTGIYGMTFDPAFDKPSLLKQFGHSYGLAFSKNVRFVATDNEPADQFNSVFPLRVNYGSGSVNLHGTQLFVFDRKGKLAAVFDNESWKIDEVADCLARLTRETR